MQTIVPTTTIVPNVPTFSSHLCVPFAHLFEKTIQVLSQVVVDASPVDENQKWGCRGRSPLPEREVSSLTLSSPSRPQARQNNCEGMSARVYILEGEGVERGSKGRLASSSPGCACPLAGRGVTPLFLFPQNHPQGWGAVSHLPLTCRYGCIKAERRSV